MVIFIRVYGDLSYVAIRNEDVDVRNLTDGYSFFACDISSTTDEGDSLLTLTIFLNSVEDL